MFDDAFGHWLAGFVDGEGHFVVRTAASSRCTRFEIKLRDDDGPILDEIQARTGLGKVLRRETPGTTSNPHAIWIVFRRADCSALVDIFDRYPLRAKKAREYAIWREAVIEWHTLPPGSARDWTRIEEIGRELIEARRYRKASYV